MILLYVACGLVVIVAIAHSILTQKLFLTPMAKDERSTGVFSSDVAKRLVFAMFHLPSVFWLGMGVSVFAMVESENLNSTTLIIFSALYGLSGLANLWAFRRPHPGGVILLTIAGLILAVVANDIA